MKYDIKISEYGITRYFIKGTKILHREDGPACEYANGYKEYYLNGKRHRVNGPAVEYPNGSKEYWYKNDLLHREDGPAFIKLDGKVMWFYEGQDIEKLYGEKLIH